MPAPARIRQPLSADVNTVRRRAQPSRAKALPRCTDKVGGPRRASGLSTEENMSGAIPRDPRRAHRLLLPARGAPSRCPTQTGGSVKVRTDGESRFGVLDTVVRRLRECSIARLPFRHGTATSGHGRDRRRGSRVVALRRPSMRRHRDSQAPDRHQEFWIPSPTTSNAPKMRRPPSPASISLTFIV